MLEILKEEGGDRLDPRCCELRLVATSGGGFRLESADGRLEVLPAVEGRQQVEPGSRRWRLRAGRSHPGFVLETAGKPGREIARTERGDEVGPGAAALHVADGRFFWIVPRIEDGWGYELRGWEVDGAYWTAAREGSEWIIAPTAAGRHVANAEEVVLLFAAEIAGGVRDASGA